MADKEDLTAVPLDELIARKDKAVSEMNEYQTKADTVRRELRPVYDEIFARMKKPAKTADEVPPEA